MIEAASVPRPAALHEALTDPFYTYGQASPAFMGSSRDAREAWPSRHALGHGTTQRERWQGLGGKAG
jgi:hypothetical protein